MDRAVLVADVVVVGKLVEDGIDVEVENPGPMAPPIVVIFA